MSALRFEISAAERSQRQIEEGSVVQGAFGARFLVVSVEDAGFAKDAFIVEVEPL
jgi:hypothetical protein